MKRGQVGGHEDGGRMQGVRTHTRDWGGSRSLPLCDKKRREGQRTEERGEESRGVDGVESKRKKNKKIAVCKKCYPKDGIETQPMQSKFVP